MSSPVGILGAHVHLIPPGIASPTFNLLKLNSITNSGTLTILVKSRHIANTNTNTFVANFLQSTTFSNVHFFKVIY